MFTTTERISKHNAENALKRELHRIFQLKTGRIFETGTRSYRKSICKAISENTSFRSFRRKTNIEVEDFPRMNLSFFR